MAYATLLREMISQPHQLEELRGLACPTLVVVGDQDSNFLDDAHQMAGVIAGAELAVIPEAGHSPQFENPEAWFIAVDTFVRGRVNAA
jgi:pimeloyl-ACP methyl ester carboxylesterase